MLTVAGPLAVLALAASPAGGVGISNPEVALEDGVVRVSPAAPAAELQVFVDGDEGLPPMLGSVSRRGDALVFQPRYPFAAGMRYRVVYRESADAPPLVERVETPPPPPRPPTRLEAVFPSSDHLPENQLKLYLFFSQPMSRGEAYRRIRLLDAGGEPVELAFLEIDQELWGREGKRLTLLFDPGRVKRDLVPHEEVGSPLRAGERFTLVVDRGWPDARGEPLAEEGRKEFTVDPPDYTSPTTATWRLETPAPATRDPLVVEFPEPLDRAMLESALEVTPQTGPALRGSVEVGAGETSWRFTPDEPWAARGYILRVATILEDRAGNSLGRPFEVDVFERVEDRVLEVTESVPFRVE